MSHTFIAYIDESGDDGLGKYRTPGAGGGASHWLTISASIWRLSRDLDALSWRDEIRGQLGVKAQSKPLHCKDMTHQQKVMAANSLLGKPFRSICVLANKPIIPDGVYTQKNQLYFYMTRYLIERISWFCRDNRRHVPEGDGKVKIVFSRRGGMSYDEFRSYLERLKGTADADVQINWPVIDIEAIEAKDHSTRAGLQIADFMATAITAGIEPDPYGNCELRYAETLRQHIYHRRGNFLSYGMKIVPRFDAIPLSDQQLAFVRLFGGK